MPLFPREMQSDRLRYRYVHPEADHVDVREWYDYHREDAPGIEAATRYLTWDPHATPKETREFVERCGERFDDGEGVTYALYPRADERNEPPDDAGEFAGTAGLGIEWDRRVGKLGIWLREPFWGRGYSGERAARLMKLAFDGLDLEVVAVEHAVENEKSRRAVERYVERFGGRREGTVRNGVASEDGDVWDTVRYSVSRAEWRDAVEGDDRERE